MSVKKWICIMLLGSVLVCCCTIQQVSAVGQQYRTVTSYHLYFWDMMTARWVPVPQSVFTSWQAANLYANRLRLQWFRIVPVRQYDAWIVNFMARGY